MSEVIDGTTLERPCGGDEPLRLMAVHAHPDDESSKGAATMARYVADGVEVLVVTCTGGERGDILNPAMDRPEVKADIGKVREAEMARAREILGVGQRWLGFVDSGFPEGDPRRRCPRAASRWSRWRRPPSRWCAPSATSART